MPTDVAGATHPASVRDRAVIEHVVIRRTVRFQVS